MNLALLFFSVTSFMVWNSFIFTAVLISPDILYYEGEERK